MSSHHIVRDEQEPALIIHRMYEFPFETLGALLEWSPTLFCCAPALEQVLAQEVKIDVVLIPFESFEQIQEVLIGQEPLKIISLRDSEYLSSGMQVLVSEGRTAVNVITTEGLIDEVIELCSQFAGRLQISVWTEKFRFTIVNATSFKKWFPADTIISFFGIQEHAALDIFSGDQPQLKADEIKIKTEGMITVKCDTPPFVMVESISKS